MALELGRNQPWLELESHEHHRTPHGYSPVYSPLYSPCLPSFGQPGSRSLNFPCRVMCPSQTLRVFKYLGVVPVHFQAVDSPIITIG